MARNIIIADKHEEYVRRLTSFIQKKYGDAYEIETFNSKMELVKRIAERKCEILLLSPELYDASLYLKNIKLPVILLGQEEHFDFPDKLKWSINKYTRISSLLVYLDKELEEVERNRPVVYGVFSPAGGVGKSTIAIAAALAYAKIGKKVLYMNLEDMDGTGMFFEDKPVVPGAVADIVSIDRYDAFLSDMIVQDARTKVMYLRRELLGVHQLFKQELPVLIERIIDNGMANIVIVDFNTSSQQFNDQLTNNLDYLLLVSDNHMHAVYKLTKWLEETHMKDKLEDKVKLVINQSKDIKMDIKLDVAGRVDKLYAANPLGICEYIAQNQLLRLHGLV